MRGSLLAGALGIGLLLAGAGPALATGAGNDTSAKLRKAVTVDGIRLHQGALNLISSLTNGNRLAGTPGYDRSADYVALQAKLAGLQVSRQSFEYENFFLADWKPPVLDVRRGKSYIPGIAGSNGGGDFGSMINSPSTDVTGPVWAADLLIPSPAPNTSTSACQAADFAGMPQGAIVLIQRGGCGELTKFRNAYTAGAAGVVYINEGVAAPGFEDPRWFDMAAFGPEPWAPMVAAQVATVADLAGSVRQGLVGKTVRFRVDQRVGTYPTENVIAETRGGDPNKVIVVGAHLDSVGTGPGINDNGSGSAAILEMARALRGVYPKNKIRFIWFSAEESGLLGSEDYVARLSDAERAKIAANLNFDMIGSPNFVNFVYDGDLSDSPPIGEDVFHPAARPFSATIEKYFLDYFRSQRIPTAPTDFDGRSDYGPFIRNGIPAGGLFTGAEGIKTPEQAAIWGGTAGEQFDPCYHEGCDNVFNNSGRALDQNSDAAAHVLITLAQTKIPDRPAITPAPAARRVAPASAFEHAGDLVAFDP
ncbi:M28 family peptidase [Solirubrobacter sp. CPCC 204708]|uniref:M28 family peptidase n=1 Tax=Solirubrobacter deserti TaxID=2282478 RepID=A0ABT4RQW5_9ACTN|nr:M28 family peptidase [Solirubrobacter deserti]MBE2320103.1 M28 family peptidase [Solirubrobacter deserti]MDA0140958.1 M28 family peptidase [Solirubrobacter deserti]